MDQSLVFRGALQDGDFLDTRPATGLIYHSRHSTVPGRYVFEIRSGMLAGALSVNAGNDQDAFVDTVTLSGIVTNPSGNPVTYQWTQVDASNAIIATPAELTTSVTLPSLGMYVFQLSATNGESFVSDTVTVIASNCLPRPSAPIVAAHSNSRCWFRSPMPTRRQRSDTPWTGAIRRRPTERTIRLLLP